MTIIRVPTNEENKDFTNIGTRNRESAESKFLKNLKHHEKEATKKGLPFATRVVRDEWEDYFQAQAKISMRKNGFVKPEEIKPMKIDWSKYSDLKNFDLIDEGFRVDDYLTKVNPGLTVRAKWEMYKYKGYSNTYRVMESGPDSILRATKERGTLVNDTKAS